MASLGKPGYDSGPNASQGATSMRDENILIDYPGTYGGRASRDEVLRVLKEALALVENCAAEAELVCAGLRIECLDATSDPAKGSRAGPS